MSTPGRRARGPYCTVQCAPVSQHKERAAGTIWRATHPCLALGLALRGGGAPGGGGAPRDGGALGGLALGGALGGALSGSGALGGLALGTLALCRARAATAASGLPLALALSSHLRRHGCRPC